MRKFFTDFEYEEGIETLTIRDEEAKHILKVLRFKVGEIGRASCRERV